MKVLIIGAAGRLGQTLMHVYSDLKPTGWTKTDLDITDATAVYDKIQALAPNLVFNAAAFADKDKAEQDRAAADAVNGDAVGYIAQACQKLGATFVHYSCSEVFDGGATVGFEEGDNTNPINAFGKSKLQGELEALQNCDNLYVIRTSWLFGWSVQDKKQIGADIVSQVMQAQAKNSALDLANDELGTPTYVLDLAQASRALVEEEKEFGIYHLVNTGTVSKYDLGCHVKSTLGLSLSLNPVASITLPRLYKAPTQNSLTNTKFLLLRPWTEALDEYLQQNPN